jgi:hypothetical protein
LRDEPSYCKNFLFYANDENNFRSIVTLSFMGVTGADEILPKLPGGFKINSVTSNNLLE